MMQFIRRSSQILTLLLAITISFLSSCNKVTQRCENWEFEDMCVPKIAPANCYDYVHRVSSICDKELEDAHNGRVSLIHEDSTKRIERHYIRPAN